MKVPSYASLINQKLLVPSNKRPFLAIDEHFVQELLEPFLDRIKFDEKWYLVTYPDVQDAIRQEVVPDAKSHYHKFGYFEHRRPYEINIDESWYLGEYPDVRDAVSKKHFPSGQAHFDFVGFKEGRFPYPGFEFELARATQASGTPAHSATDDSGRRLKGIVA